MAVDVQAGTAALPVLTVSQFTDVLKEIVEQAFPLVWVTGEVTNFSRHSPSGHCYFVLKDDRSCIKAAIWKSTAQQVKADLHDGMELIVRGHLDCTPAVNTSSSSTSCI